MNNEFSTEDEKRENAIVGEEVKPDSQQQKLEPKQVKQAEKLMKPEKQEKPLIRYLVRMNFYSFRKVGKKIEKEVDSEYYFECGRRNSKQRTPTRGYFTFNIEEPSGYIDLKDSFNLYSEIITEAPGKEIDLPITFKQKSRNPLKSDDLIFYLKPTVVLGEKSQQHTLREEEFEIKIITSSIKISY